MSYIERNLLPDEQIYFSTKKSLVIFMLPALWTVFSIFATLYMRQNFILIKLAWTPWIIAIIWWAYYGLEYVTSEFDVTNKRILMREGFFNRHATELRLSTISQVNVDQSLFGQLLNYGVVSLNAFGAYDVYPTISRPLGFQRAINEQLDQVTR